MTSTPGTLRSGDREEGSALLIALILVLALGLVLGALATFARGALLTTTNLSSQRSIELDATNAVTAAMQSVRRSYTDSIYTSTAGTNCLPNQTPLPNDPYYVFCVGTAAPGSLLSRQVQFYACTTSSSCITTPADQVLYAVANYDDIPEGATPAGYSACSTTTTATCGVRMIVAVWDLRVDES